MNKTIEVQTDAGPVVVRKLALNDYAELLRALKNLPKEFGKYIEGNSADDLKSNEKLFEILPTLIADAIPEFCAVLACVTDKDAAFHGEHLDLADNIEVFAAALELNDYQKIGASIKKIMAPKSAPTNQATAAPEAPEPQKS